MLFPDRSEAGRRLAKNLMKFKDRHPVVLALPRGGVPVGLEIARALAAPLDLVLVRKIGAPFQQELAIGAIADGEHSDLVTDPRLIAHLEVSGAYLEQAKSAASWSTTASAPAPQWRLLCVPHGGGSRPGWCSRCRSRRRTR